MGSWYPPEQEEQGQFNTKDADMHAGNDMYGNEVYRLGGLGEDQEQTPDPADQIDWEAHERFMRGL